MLAMTKHSADKTKITQPTSSITYFVRSRGVVLLDGSWGIFGGSFRFFTFWTKIAPVSIILPLMVSVS